MTLERLVREWVCSLCFETVRSIGGPPLGWTFRAFWGPSWVRCPVCGPAEFRCRIEA